MHIFVKKNVLEAVELGSSKEFTFNQGDLLTI